MRILLAAAPPRGRPSEDGAIAIVVAFLAVVLFGISAFTVDFGMAYMSKRQLQTGVDAGALAAASVYAKKPGTCYDLVSSGLYEVEAQAAADAILAENRPDSTPSAFTVVCNSDEQPVVGYSATGTTPVTLGSVYGTGSITTQRSAKATVSVPTTVKAMRPYMICSNHIPDPPYPSNTFTKVTFPGPGPGACPTANNPGNWWSIDCPEDNNNGELGENTLNGCTDDVSIVPNQPPAIPAPDPNDALHDVLVDACPALGGDQDCLGANTGTINGSQVRDAWEGLVGESIYLPTFCGDDVCNPAAVVDGGGNNAKYPVFSFVAVKVCGWSFGSHDSGQYTDHFPSPAPTDPCLIADASLDSTDHLLLVFKQVQISGTTGESTCGIGDPCDGGLRRVLLTE